MLVITGTQRSGTTLMANLLREGGYDLGSDLWDEAGGLENELISGFYRDYLGDPRFPFDDYPWPACPPRRFKLLNYKVVKFSYLLMNPAFVYIWHKFRPEGDVFLVMNRNKTDVVKSKLRLPERFEHDSDLLTQGPRGLAENFRMSLGILCGFYDIATLQFPACISSLGATNNVLRLLDPSVQIEPEVWVRLVDPSKVHFK